jgi:DNA-binding NarL/FixJ family response regulator
MKRMQWRVLICDDHLIVLKGLQKILERPGFEVVGAVHDGRALVMAAARLKPDIIVADVSMPMLNGFEALQQIRRENSRAKIIMLTMHEEAAYAVEAIRSGANGYLLKSSDEDELIAAIKEVLAGGIYITPSLEQTVLSQMRAPRVSSRGLNEVLTPRQREVLQLLAEGRKTKQIAALLHVSVKTVEFHKYRIMEVLGIRTVAGLAAYSTKHGIVA